MADDQPPPVRSAGWSAAAVIVIALLAVVTWCMAAPVRWDGLGKVGALALDFPLHLLVITAVAVLIALILLLRRDQVGAALWVTAGVFAAALACIPTLALAERAHVYGVHPHLREYVRDWRHVNYGRPTYVRSASYGITPDGTVLLLDVWRTHHADTLKRYPAIVMIHGGAWTAGHRSTLPDWDRWFNASGYDVFDVEYRLAPPARAREEVGDVKSALGWIAAHSDSLRIDPAQLILMGGSAGANLALLAAYSAGDSTLPPSTFVPTVRPCAVIAVSAPSDLALLYDSAPSPTFLRTNLRAYVGGSLADERARYRALSPVTHVARGEPATLAFIGTNDRLSTVEQGVRLDSALTVAEVPHEFYYLPATDHLYDMNWGNFATQLTRTKITRFLGQYAGPHCSGNNK